MTNCIRRLNIFPETFPEIIDIIAITIPKQENIIATILAQFFAFHRPLATKKLSIPKQSRITPTMINKTEPITPIKGILLATELIIPAPKMESIPKITPKNAPI